MSQSSISPSAALPWGHVGSMEQSIVPPIRVGAGCDDPSVGSDEHSRLLQFQTELSAAMGLAAEGSAGEVVGRCLLQHIRPLRWVQAGAAAAAKAPDSGTTSSVFDIDDCLAKLRPGGAVPADVSPELREAVDQLAVQSLMSGRSLCVKYTENAAQTSVDHEIVICAIPLKSGAQTPQSKVVCIAARGSSSTLVLAMLSTYVQAQQQLFWLQLLAEQARGSRFHQTLSRGNTDLNQAPNLSQAATALLTRWAEQLRLSHLAWVAICSSRRPYVVAISGALDLDPVSRWAVGMVEATQVLAKDAAIGRWSTAAAASQQLPSQEVAADAEVGKANGLAVNAEAVKTVKDSTSTHCLQSVASELLAPAILACPCSGVDGVAGYLFLVGPPEIVSSQWSERHAAALADMRSQVVLAGLVHQSAWRRLVARPSRLVRRWRWWLLGVGLFLVALAAWPAPYKMDCTCELTTTDRRYAVAPYQGTLQQVLVKPGEVVAAGSLLATMDDRELKIELAGKQAAYERERNQIASWRSVGDLAKARIAELESERIAQEVALLNHHLAHREIRAPIAGTIVQGDLAELMGAPVEIGNNLFEVAGLSDLLVQVEIPEYQYRFARPGQEVRLYLEAFPYDLFSGTIERLHPRATTREDRNVFLAELRLPNVDSKLRPGMKGRAQIAGDAFPLAWKWLHYPYEKARSIVGWF